MTRKIIIPIPSYGADPTELCVPLKILHDAGFDITFATPDGEKACVDMQMLRGENLGIWKGLLKTGKDAVQAHSEIEQDPDYNAPIKYSDIRESGFDAVYLPGGHDKRMRPFLESTVLQQQIVRFFKAEKPVGAICHGVVLLARSIDPDTGKSVLFNYKTTALLKSQETAAYALMRLWLGDYYLTYPGLLVEDEVTASLSDLANFVHGPTPMLRDSPSKLGRGFVLRDRHYVSARWPGDAYNFSDEFVKLLNEPKSA